MNKVIKDLLKRTFVYQIMRKKTSERRNKQLESIKYYFKLENTEMFTTFCKALNDAGITFWLEFGTLLGYYREHDFIPHDLDIDTGTYYENAPLVQSTLEKAGFKLVREYKVLNDGGIEQCYLYKHITIDVFYFRKDGNKMYCNSFCENGKKKIDLSKRKYINKPIPVGVKRIEVPLMEYIPTKFKNCNVFVPKDIDKYLRTHYGDNYMIPNPKYNNKTDSSNIIWYDYDDVKGEAIFKLPYYANPEEYGLL